MFSFFYGRQAGKDLGSLAAWDMAYGETDLLTDVVHASKPGSSRCGEYKLRYGNARR